MVFTNPDHLYNVDIMDLRPLYVWLLQSVSVVDVLSEISPVRRQPVPAQGRSSNYVWNRLPGDWSVKCGVWSVLPSHHHNHVIDVIDAVNTLYHITLYHIISHHITSYHSKLIPRPTPPTECRECRQCPAKTQTVSIIAKILGWSNYTFFLF